MLFGSKEDKIKKLVEKKNGEKLAAFVNDHQENIQVAAILGLGQVGGEVAVNTLVPLLHHSSAVIRSATAQAMGVMGDPRTKAHLDHQMKSETDEKVKASIVTALGHIQSRD